MWANDDKGIYPRLGRWLAGVIAFAKQEKGVRRNGDAGTVTANERKLHKRFNQLVLPIGLTPHWASDRQPNAAWAPGGKVFFKKYYPINRFSFPLMGGDFFEKTWGKPCGRFLARSAIMDTAGADLAGRQGAYICISLAQWKATENLIFKSTLLTTNKNPLLCE